MAELLISAMNHKPRTTTYVPVVDYFWRVNEIAEEQDQVMLLTFLRLGARRNEVFALKKADLDFRRKQIRLWTKKRESGLEYDWVPMTDQLTSVLQDWCAKPAAMPTIDNDHVFVCLSETAFCDEYYGNKFKHRLHLMRRLCFHAGVKPFGFHAIRHLKAYPNKYLGTNRKAPQKDICIHVACRWLGNR